MVSLVMLLCKPCKGADTRPVCFCYPHFVVVVVVDGECLLFLGHFRFPSSKIEFLFLFLPDLFRAKLITVFHLLPFFFCVGRCVQELGNSAGREEAMLDPNHQTLLISFHEKKRERKEEKANRILSSIT